MSCVPCCPALCRAPHAPWMRCCKNALKIADIPMRYWDTSAILPLVADERARERLLELYEEDSQIVAWGGGNAGRARFGGG